MATEKVICDTDVMIDYFDNRKTRPIELLNTYNLSHGLAIPDGLIAASAIETNLKLFTYNMKDFKFIKGLEIYK